MEKNALIAMSGGVDSSAAAWLTLQEGYRCAGGTMRLFRSEDAGISEESGCCSLEDVEDARLVAVQLGIPHYVFNFTADFREKVMDKFAQTYLSGQTPNPCMDCNRCLKFDKLLLRARQLGLETIVTGHYARVERQGDRWLLRKGLAPEKDQSYFLAMLTQVQLARARFPLGGLRKEEVREIARAQGFANAHKRDSQDVCFLPDGDCGAFLERWTGQPLPPGDLLGEDGTVLGRHRGAARYTIGQRRGLGTACGKPMYVLRKDMVRNAVILGPNSRLFSRTLTAGDLNWIVFDRLTAPLRAKARIRYRHEEQWAEIRPLEEGRMELVFDVPQRAISPGQTVVLYDGEYVLGGGTILSADVP